MALDAETSVDYVAALAGEWRLDRRVVDHAAMTGLAVFTPSGATLHYRESGHMVLETGQALQFSRSYIYRFNKELMEVLFDEQPLRLFQSVVLTRQEDQVVGKGSHDCPPDTYTSRYRFMLPRAFSISHQVQGPRKFFVIETDFSRAR